VGVAEAAVAAARDHRALAGRVEVGEQGFLVVGQDLGADRHPEHDVVAAGARAVGAGAVAALARLEVLGVAVVDQGVQAPRPPPPPRRRPGRRCRRPARRTR
jgi:hypothetical protein